MMNDMPPMTPEMQETITNVVTWMATSRACIEDMLKHLPDAKAMPHPKLGMKITNLRLALEAVLAHHPSYHPELSTDQQKQELARSVEEPRQTLEEAARVLSEAMHSHNMLGTPTWLGLNRLYTNARETLMLYPFKR